MPRFPHLRVILESVPQSGRWNMSVDEALLETACSSEVATLRWYQWNEPTVSLGYFQKFTDLASHPRLSQLPVVRRLTGGGAILHDDEWTYCVTLPASQTLFKQPHELYDIVHAGIIAGLRHLGFPVELRKTTLKQDNEPLLCFQRQDSHDISLSGKKVLGSAQRRRRGAIMEHGSLIRRASRFARQIPGIADLCHLPIPENVAGELANHVAAAIACSWSFGSLTENETQLAQSISEQQDLKVRIR